MYLLREDTDLELLIKVIESYLLCNADVIDGDEREDLLRIKTDLEEQRYIG